MTVFIYCLIDPGTTEIRYVGKAIDVVHRVRQHLCERRPCWLTNWLKALRNEGSKPDIEILEVIADSNDEDWQESERWWISYLRSIGCPLTNLDSGGRRGKRMSESSRQKLRQLWLGRKHSESAKEKIRAWNLGRKMPPQAVEKSRLANIGKTLSVEHRAKISKAGKGRKHSEETKARIRSSLLGQKRTSEQIERIRQSQKGKILSIEHRNAIGRGVRAYLASTI